MEGCLLCLEIDNKLLDGIKVNSTQWQELNIENLIEQHLWKIQSIQSSSWICTTCWKDLYDFHKFYTHIEKVQKRTGSALKIEFVHESEISIQENLSPELIVEEKTIIKEERDEDLWEDDMPLIQISKRKRKTIEYEDKDPLNKSKRINHASTKKTKKSKKTKCIQKLLNEVPIVKQNMEHSEIKKETDSLQIDELNDDNTDSDSNYEPLTESTPSIENKLCHKNSKAINQENDKFIAENFKITCIICQDSMDTFQALYKHFKQEHNQQGYIICCKKKFNRRSLLVDHVHQHLDPNYFKCNDCGKVAADRLCLRLHSKIHEATREKIHCCDICGKGFVTRKVLNTHKAIHLSEEEKMFPCSDCGKNFGNKLQLSNHVRAVHLNLNAKICDICGKSIRCKEVFERHIAEHKGRPLPTVSCDVCGLLLANKHGLKRHKEMIHPVGGKQDHICPICSKISPNLKAHKKHIQYKHELGYNHKCTICEKAFKTAKTLMEHMATHTGTVLYTCPWCPKTFNSNANMHSHRKKVHPKEWEEETRKKYSGNLPPNFKPPITNKRNGDYAIPLML